MKRPNFFIVGAPKCGTTSLASYLGEHPEICMSRPKEPHYFNTDLPYRGCSDLQEYMTCFANASKQTTAVGEASTSYLFSEAAVSNILEFDPGAKFIAMVRNPIDMAYAFHSELLWSGQEHVKSFQEAWALQAERKSGKCISWLCLTPQFLQYKRVCLLGEQVQRLLKQVDSDRVCILVFDDLCIAPQAVYRQVLAFLNVSLDQREAFPVSNPSKKPRIRAITAFSQKVSDTKRSLGISAGFGCMRRLVEWNTVATNRPALPAEFRRELAVEFESDVNRLSDLLDRDLSHWLDHRPISPARKALKP